jgi:alkylation response protein AidB-like acyl-CoA dehydrogenase
LGADRRKFWITNGGEAGFFLVFANGDFSKGYKGITGFIVEREFPGFSVGKKENKLGIRASSTTELILENCKVPKENVLGPVGRGTRSRSRRLNEGRIESGADDWYRAGALESAIQYVKERRQFGKAVAEFQGVQFQLGQMATELEAAALVYNTARLKDSVNPFLREAAMAKLFSSQVADRITSQCLELFGGSRLFQGISGGEVLPGRQDWDDLRRDSNMQLQTIAKLILKEP